MKIETACIECIINQSRRVADAIGADAELRQKLIQSTEKLSQNFSFQDSPPEAAYDVYAAMSQLADKKDLYDNVKALSTKKAAAFLPVLRQKLETAEDLLLDAVKIAVAGNVIDLAAEISFDLDTEMEKIFRTHFAIDNFKDLRYELENAKTVLYIGDNVGEHLFDYLCIETIQKIYSNLQIFYMVRGEPIINDVTMKEAKEAGFDTLCHLVDSGVNTPGFVYERANSESRKLFDEADLVITKGMGNYECLSPTHRSHLFFLLKVKCQVVAASLESEVGDIICKRI